MCSTCQLFSYLPDLGYQEDLRFTPLIPSPKDFATFDQLFIHGREFTQQHGWFHQVFRLVKQLLRQPRVARPSVYVAAILGQHLKKYIQINKLTSFLYLMTFTRLLNF
jgi:hypothetical protein